MFDKVEHEKLLQKLHLYGIRGDILKWIKNFLDNRKQSVVTNGFHSCTIPVSSGVQQGFVLGPILFLAYLNDLPEHVRSRVRLFADDTAMYLCISNISEANILQEDLYKLEKWEEAWDMSINPSKCQVLYVTRLKTPIPSKYSLHNKELERVTAAKYLRVTISDNLNWGTHLDNITKKANQTLGFLKRNIKVHNQNLKSTAYKTLIQPQLEYAPTAWSHTLLLTYTNFNLFNAGLPGGLLTSSVTTMLGNLNWCILDQRCIESRLVMMYKVTYDLVTIPAYALNTKSKGV